jgi:predicted nucleic acid-binding protein
MNEISSASRVYVDSNIFIYFLELNPEYFIKAQEFFDHIDAVGARLLTNEYTLAECIYQPSRSANFSLVAMYESLFEKEGEVELLGLDGALAKRAAFVGGDLGLKLADAIHFMSALEAGCDFFVTADTAFKSGPAMKVLRLAA